MVRNTQTHVLNLLIQASNRVKPKRDTQKVSVKEQRRGVYTVPVVVHLIGVRVVQYVPQIMAVLNLALNVKLLQVNVTVVFSILFVFLCINVGFNAACSKQQLYGMGHRHR